VQEIPPTTTFSLIAELSSRDALRIALSGRDAHALTPVLAFLLRHLTHTHFGPLASQATLVALDLYGAVVGQSPEVDDLLERMLVKVDNELRMERDVLLGVQGMLDMVLSNSVVGSARARAGAKGLLGVDSGVQAEV
jgi:U3 small nucleolar RNA-associated protein 15